MDGGEEKIGDANELAQIRRQALKVHIESLLLAAVLTAAAYFVPV